MPRHLVLTKWRNSENVDDLLAMLTSGPNFLLLGHPITDTNANKRRDNNNNEDNGQRWPPFRNYPIVCI